MDLLRGKKLSEERLDVERECVAAEKLALWLCPAPCVPDVGVTTPGMRAGGCPSSPEALRGELGGDTERAESDTLLLLSLSKSFPSGADSAVVSRGAWGVGLSLFGNLIHAAGAESGDVAFVVPDVPE